MVPKTSVSAGRARPPGEHALLVWNNPDAAVAAAHRVDPDRWWTAYGAVLDRVESRFTRYEPLRHGRVNGWAWLRRDSDKNNAPRARLMLARWVR